MLDAFTQNLAAIQAQHYRALANMFEYVDEHDDAMVIIALRLLFRFTDVAASDISNGLGLTTRACERWSEGHVPAHPLIRKIVIDWIVRDLRERADMIDAFPEDLGSPEDDYIPQRFLPWVHRPRV